MRCAGAVAVAAAVLGAGCTSVSVPRHVGVVSVPLATVDAGAGHTVRYAVDVQAGSGEATLQVVDESTRQRPFLGFQVAVLDADAAARRGREAGAGLLVTGTYEASAAAAAGVRAGDVLVALGDRPVFLPGHVDAAEAALQPGEAIAARLVRDGTPVALELRAQALQERVADTQSVPLEAPPPSHPFAGVQLRGIPSAWCARIWGRPRAAVLVALVDVGSPAWRAGVRPGDFVEEVDGRPVPDVRELALALAAAGEAGRATTWRVQGEDGPHTAVIALHDYARDWDLWLPLLAEVHDGVRERHWSAGPFGLLVSSRTTCVDHPRARAAEERSVCSVLGGLVRVTDGPGEHCVRLFWLLHLGG